MMLTTMSLHSEMLISLELFIYPGLTILLMICIYVLFGQVHQMTQTVTHNLSISVDKCLSEDCVRCNKYQSIVKKVSDQYRSKPELQTIAGDRLHEALLDIASDKLYADEPQQPNVLFLKNLRASPWWTEHEFVSDIAVVESEYDVILEEFNKVYKQVWPDGWLVNNTAAGQWAVFHLINQGVPVQKNCCHCPKTYDTVTKLVSSMQNNVFANVSFSVVQSGTHISPHYGPTNVRVRCHLGLRIPDGSTTYMDVHGDRKSWCNGKCLLFDDSYLHEVVHEDDLGQPRAVLLIDLWHPELTDTEKVIIDDLFRLHSYRTQSTHVIPIESPPNH